MKKPKRNDKYIHSPRKAIYLYLLISAIILSSGVYFYVDQKAYLTVREESSLLSIADLKVEQINGYLNERYSDADYFYGNQTFISLVKNLNTSQLNEANEINDWLAPVLKDSLYASINIIDVKTTKAIFSVGCVHDYQDHDILPDELLSIDTRQSIFGDLFFHQKQNSIHFDIYVPLILSAGTLKEIIAVMVLSLDPHKGLFDLMQSWPTSSPSGEVLVVKKEKDQVVFLNELKHKKGTALKLQLPLSSADLPAARGVSGYEGIMKGFDYRGVKVLAAVKKIPVVGWVVVTKIDYDEVFSSLQFRSMLIISIGIISMLALGFSFYSFWRGRENGFLKSQISNVDQIHRLNRLYKVLSNSNQAIIRAGSKNELMNEVCSIASHDGGYILCCVTMVHEKTGLCIPVASDGEAKEILEHIVISARPDIPEGKGATGQTIRENHFVVINDIWIDERMAAWRDKVVRYNLRSLSVFPLHVNSKIIGTINFYSTDAEYFNDEEIQLLNELSNDLSYALQKFEDEQRRVRAEEALLLNEQEMRATLYSIGDGVISVDCKGSLVLMNNAAEQLTGWTEQEAKGRCVREVFDIMNESSRETIDNPVFRVLQEGINVELANHTILRDRSGTERSIADCCAPICDNQGKVSGAVLIFRDQTTELIHKRQLRESEIQFRSLFESMIEGVALHELIYDSNGIPVDYRILDVNSAFMMHTGIDTDDIRGALASIFFGTAEAPYLNEYARVMETLIPYSFETYFPPLDKYFSIVCFSYQKGRFATVFEDITQRKRTVGNLHKSEERYKMLVHNVPAGVFLVDTHGKFIEVNELMVLLTGSTEHKLLGMHWTSLVYAEDSAYVQRIWEKSSEKKEQFTIEFRISVSEGQFKWISGNVIPVLDESGELENFLGAVMDISERKNAEKERMLLKAELFESQRLESIGTLAGGIAHDFNNILNIIMGYAFRLQNSDRSSEKHKSAIETIIKAGDRGANLVQQILTFARKKKNVFANLELHSLLKEIIKMLRETFPHSISIETALTHGIPSIYADMTQIHQAILNICVNARDAMPAGGTLMISTDIVSGSSLREDFARATEDSYVHIIIKDTGIGIEEEIRTKIFEPFFTTKPTGMGTGLGLSVVYGIVENHHGIIDIETAHGIGTSFHLYLPEIKNISRLNDEFSTVIKDLPKGNEGVLIIEDEEMTLELLSDTLQSVGYTVFTAPNGSEGIMMFEKEMSKIDLVLCDVDLPVLNGIEVVRQVIMRQPSVKILMMSGFFSQNIQRDLERLGVRGFLEKPIAMQNLLLSLRKILDS